MAGVKLSTLHDWYKNHLSDYTTQANQKKQHQYDLPPPPGSKEPPIAVPILKPENMGARMCIDEKQMAGTFYTVLSNHDTGKIAMMAATHRKQDLDKIMVHFGDKRWAVKTLARDLSATYEWVGKEHFQNAYQVADKFHIISHALDALHDVRIFHRQKLLSQKREQMQQTGKSKNIPDEPLSNGDSHAELLARSRGLLFKNPTEWTPSQANRAEVLFKHYPDIKTAYYLIMEFRNWYAKENIGKSIQNQINTLNIWMKRAQQSAISEIQNFAALVARHQGVIANYFISGITNAKAEATNRVIQSLLAGKVNTRNMDFLHFRLNLLLS